MNKIAPAFVAAKKAFGPALKDKSNPAFRSKYADLGACIDAVEEALLANGIAFFQETSEDPTGVTVETVFLHESGESLRCGKLHVPASKQDPQGYGSALTYARRYSLMASCGIAPEDDDGNAATKATTTKGNVAQANGAKKSIEEVVKGIVDGVKAGDAKGAAAYLASLKESALKTLWDKIPEDVQDELTVNWPEVAA
jgi:ERF superfamily protein